MAASDAIGKISLFRRGLNAARLALAFAVTAVIVTIVVYAVIVVSRTEPLALSVAGGIIHARPLLNYPKLLGLTFSVKANNPSGRVRFYYTDIHGSILLKNGTSNVTLANFNLGRPPNMVVAPVSMLQTDADVNAVYYDDITTYFNELRVNKSSSIITDAMLKLNGTLTVGLYSVQNKTSDRRTFYYCWPLTIGAVSNASTADAAGDDVPCLTYDPTKY